MGASTYQKKKKSSTLNLFFILGVAIFFCVLFIFLRNDSMKVFSEYDYDASLTEDLSQRLHSTSRIQTHQQLDSTKNIN